MEEVYRDGRVKAVGVSNFYPDRFMDLALFSEIRSMVSQLETHVLQQHKNDRRFIEKYRAKVEVWTPSTRGEKGIFINPVLTSIGQKYGKTTGQVALRFLVQSGILVIPKSAHKERMAESLDILDLQLNAEEMGQIEALDQGVNLFMNHEDTAQIEDFFIRSGVKQRTEAEMDLPDEGAYDPKTMSCLRDYYAGLYGYMHFQYMGMILGTGCGSPDMTRKIGHMKKPMSLENHYESGGKQYGIPESNERTLCLQKV